MFVSRLKSRCWDELGELFLRYFPLALLIVFFLLRYVAQDVYNQLVAEDGAVEDATFIVYVVGGGLAAATARWLHAKGMVAAAVLYGLVCAALLGIAVEEISWGQRMFGFKGPELIIEHNKQDEANVHNLLRRPFLHAVYLIVGVYGAGLGRVLLRRLRPLRSWSWLLVPDRSLFWYFSCVVLIYGWFELSAYLLEPVFGQQLNPRLLGLSRLQEVAELGLALGFLLLVWSVYSRTKALRRQPPATPLSEGTPDPDSSPTATQDS